MHGEIVFSDLTVTFGSRSISTPLQNGIYSIHFKADEKENISKLIIYNKE